MATKREGEKSKNTIFIRGLPSSATNESLETFFSDIGPIKRCFVITEKGSKTCVGTGYVQFALKQEAQKAVTEFQGKLFPASKKRLRIEMAEMRLSEDKRKQKTNKSDESVDSDTPQKEEGVSQVRKSHALLERSMAQQRRTIAIDLEGSDENLLEMSSKTILRKRFRKLGEIESFDHPASGNLRKALVTFKNLLDAMTALKKIDGHTVHGVTLSAKMLKKDRDSRLIIRNLPFKIAEDRLRSLFSPYGVIEEISIPQNPARGTSRGFAFVQLATVNAASQALQGVNGSTIDGRTVAVDWSVGKSVYSSILQKEAEGSTADKTKKRKAPGDGKEKDQVPDAEVEDANADGENSESGEEMEEEEADEGGEDVEEEEDMDEEGEEDEEDEKEGSASNEAKSAKTKAFDDFSVFVRGLAYETTAEQLEDFCSRYGRVRYAKIVINPEVGLSRGTAFVCFRSTEARDAALQAGVAAGEYLSAQREQQLKARKSGRAPATALSAVIPAGESASLAARGIPILAGRVIQMNPLVSKDEAAVLNEKRKEEYKQMHDKRNLYLASEGVVDPKSDAAETMSKADLEKRARAEKDKKLKLKNPNFFVSSTRLSVRNLPTTLTERGLKDLLTKVLKETQDVRGFVRFKQVKLLFEAEVDKKTAQPVSKGLGFVEFHKHEHALAALRALNNNPTVFGAAKRPIVEFAIEDVRKLKLREKMMEQRIKRQQKNEAFEKEKPQTKAKESTSQPKPPKAKTKQSGEKPTATPNRGKRSRDNKASDQASKKRKLQPAKRPDAQPQTRKQRLDKTVDTLAATEHAQYTRPQKRPRGQAHPQARGVGAGEEKKKRARGRQNRQQGERMEEKKLSSMITSYKALITKGEKPQQSDQPKKTGKRWFE